jgi:predicted outer membrane protein
MHISVPPLLACATVAVAAACASGGRYNSSSAPGNVDITANRGSTLDARELQILRGMSDADILGHLITVDSIEVVTADSALRLSKSDQVLDLAKRMKATHAANFRQDKDLAKQQNITPTTVFGGFNATHVAASLDSVGIASDLTIDRHYVVSQVELHRHVLAELEALQDRAQNAAVRQYLVTVIPTLRDDLSRAQTLAVQKGFERKRS